MVVVVCQDFHKLEVQSRELYVRYVYKLYDLHVLAENHTEAGFTLKLHAELLSWSDQVLPETPDSRWPEQLEWQRKDAIYHKIIGEFNRGKVFFTNTSSCLHRLCTVEAIMLLLCHVVHAVI